MRLGTSEVRRVSNEGYAILGVIFPLEPIIKAQEDPGHVLFCHDPQFLDVKILSVVLDVFPDERVHVVHQQFHRSLLDQ